MSNNWKAQNTSISYELQSISPLQKVVRTKINWRLIVRDQIPGVFCKSDEFVCKRFCEDRCGQVQSSIWNEISDGENLILLHENSRRFENHKDTMLSDRELTLEWIWEQWKFQSQIRSNLWEFPKIWNFKCNIWEHLLDENNEIFKFDEILWKSRRKLSHLGTSVVGWEQWNFLHLLAPSQSWPA